MTDVIRQSRHRIIVGYELAPNGITRAIYRPVSTARNHMRVPVTWNGQNGVLYFQHWQRKAGFNQTATHLFNRQGFDIYGPAIVEIATATWSCLRVHGSETHVRAQIAHLSLGRHDVVPTSRRDTHQDVVAETASDIMMLKIVL